MREIRFIGISAMATIIGGALLSMALSGQTSTVVAAETAEYANAPCTDSEGATTGFFCQPVSVKGALIKACSKKKPKDLAACQSESVSSFCSSRSFNQVLSYNIDSQGNLAEVVCSRQVQSFAAAPVEEWQPMFNVDLRGYDHREIAVAQAQDWKSCKAACDNDGQCKAWTLVPERKLCFLKWDDNPELLSSNSCCITGIKGMASAGAASTQKNVKTPEELIRLGRRTKDAAEDEVGRRAEEKIRRSLGKILSN